MDPKKTGRGMILVACILGMVVLTMFFSEVEDHQRNPNQAPVTTTSNGIVEVNLERNRFGHYVTSGTINNQPVEFLLDTGATDVVIPGEEADRLGLERGRPGRAMTANGAVTVYQTRLEQLSIGGIELHDVRASINPSMSSPGILLGMSALEHIEFNQKGDSLTLRQY
ncbi:MAG: TIGR02281 family clan AA aspartic protease [Pseudomonadales bacterium]|nr:TIGR02281 family clan AA aspartic protease [Pseudomonadales bacterium]